MRTEVPSSYQCGIREMMDEAEAEEDIVVLNWEDVEVMFEDWSQPPSDDEKDDHRNHDGSSDENRASPPEDEMEEEDIPDHSVAQLTAHSRSVFCCGFHPNGNFAITGGEDDKAVLWNLTTNKPVSVLSHYQDSVCEVGFSFDGSFVAVADMMGNIEVYRTDSDSLLTKVWSERIEEVQWMEWHKQAHVLLAGGWGNNVYMWKIPSGECKVFSGECTSPAGTFMPDGKRAIVGYRNGSVRVFDLVTGEMSCSFKNKDLKVNEIISLAVHPNNNLAVVGDLGGNIALFTTQHPAKVVREMSFGDVVGSDPLRNPCCIENMMFSRDAEVSALLVSSSRGLYICNNNTARMGVKKYVEVNPGVTKMVSVGTDKVAVGTTAGAIVLIDTRQGEIIHTFTGHSDTILSLALSSDEKKLLSTSDDTTVRLFNLTEYVEAT